MEHFKGYEYFFQGTVNAILKNLMLVRCPVILPVLYVSEPFHYAPFLLCLLYLYLCNTERTADQGKGSELAVNDKNLEDVQEAPDTVREKKKKSRKKKSTNKEVEPEDAEDGNIDVPSLQKDAVVEKCKTRLKHRCTSFNIRCWWECLMDVVCY